MERFKKMSNTTKIVMLFLLLLLTVVAIYLSSPSGPLRNDPNIYIYVTPSDSNVTLDGKNIGDGNHYVEPGEYELKVEREGFESVAYSVSVGKTLSKEVVSLRPVSSEARKWAEENADVYFEAEAISGQAIAEEGEAFRSSNPITSVLPFESVLYSIDYKVSEKNPDKLVIVIGADTKENREFALDKIRSWGYDPDDYGVEYVSFMVQ